MPTKIRIDGGYGEGGGQILRTALSLSAILGAPFEMANIRRNRKTPGLRPQHLVAVQALSALTSAKTAGAELSSTRLSFDPGPIEAGDYAFDVGTAGSAVLVLQSMLPPLLFAGGPSRVRITGGTHVPWSPSFHYFRDVFLPLLEEMGGVVRTEISTWGFHPKGGGKIESIVSPLETLRAVDRTVRGELREVEGFSAVSNLPRSIGERQRKSSLRRLEAAGCPPPRIQIVAPSSRGPGTVVFLKAAFERSAAGFTSLGEKGKPAEKVADEACAAFLEFMKSDAAVDRHLGDQMVPYMALAKGPSSLSASSITKHLLANVWVVQQFLSAGFDVNEETGLVKAAGVNFSS